MTQKRRISITSTVAVAIATAANGDNKRRLCCVIIAIGVAHSTCIKHGWGSMHVRAVHWPTATRGSSTLLNDLAVPRPVLSGSPCASMYSEALLPIHVVYQATSSVASSVCALALAFALHRHPSRPRLLGALLVAGRPAMVRARECSLALSSLGSLDTHGDSVTERPLTAR